MERYTMFLDQKNQYFQNGYATQGNQQIQFNPYQITNDIFHRTNILKFMWKQETWNSQSNPEEKQTKNLENQTP